MSDSVVHYKSARVNTAVTESCVILKAWLASHGGLGQVLFAMTKSWRISQGVASSIPARYHTFVEIDHEIISTVILLLPLIYSRRVVVSYKRKYVHKLLVNRLLKPAQEKVWLSELTVPQ